MKKTVLFSVAAVVLAAGIAIAADLPTIGCVVYKFDDTFMTAVRNSILKTAEGKAKLDLVDAQNCQATENDKVDLFITKKVKALAINPVDRAAAGVLVQKAMAAGIPIVFFNREPFKDDLAKFHKAYYVGAKAEQSGTMEGQIVARVLEGPPRSRPQQGRRHPVRHAEGGPRHQDANCAPSSPSRPSRPPASRSRNSPRTPRCGTALKAQEKMAALLAAYAGQIEVVFANNDDMALGAIEALKAAGYFKGGKYMPVVGVDATPPALDALEQGTLLGTVLNDAKNQGQATFELADSLAAGKARHDRRRAARRQGRQGRPKGKYVWVPYQMVTKDNYKSSEVARADLSLARASLIARCPLLL